MHRMKPNRRPLKGIVVFKQRFRVCTQAMLAVHDTGQLLRFVQRGNDVDLVEGRASLTEVGRYSELVALLQARGCHEAALDVLKTLSQSPQTLQVEPAGEFLELCYLNLLYVGPGCYN